MNRIKELRNENGMKQEELAAALHVRRQTVSRYETGLLDLDTDTIGILCQVFNVTSDYLLGLSSVRSPELTEEEYALVAAYRASDPRTRQLVELQLEPYMKKENTAAG